ncbi:hypothetical protein ACFX2C_037483 [Malus domestica]
MNYKFPHRLCCHKKSVGHRVRQHTHYLTVPRKASVQRVDDVVAGRLATHKKVSNEIAERQLEVGIHMVNITFILQQMLYITDHYYKRSPSYSVHECPWHYGLPQPEGLVPQSQQHE